MKLTFVIEEDGGRYVAYCKELDTASSGREIPEALRNIADATVLKIQALQESGEWPLPSMEHLQARGRQASSTVELVEAVTPIVEKSRQQRLAEEIKKERREIE